MNKLALSMIAKGTKAEAKKLANCLKSSAKYVDGVFLYVNNADISKIPKADFDKLAAKYNATIQFGVWQGSFGEARNKSFAMVPDDYDFILWLDADDTLQGGKHIPAVLKRTNPGVGGVYATYEYDVDESGNVTTEHSVARIIRNNGSYAWSNKLVHETLEPTRRVGQVSTDMFWVTHQATDSDRDKSLLRNIELLERELDGEGDQVDARTLYYLGTHYVDAGRYDEATELLNMYLKFSGWPEERSQAHIQLGHLSKSASEARMHYLRAVDEDHSNPSPFYELGMHHLHQEDYSKAVFWLEMAVIKKSSMNTIATNPLISTYLAPVALAQANFYIGGDKIDKALQWAKHASKTRDDEVTNGLIGSIEDIINQRDELSNFINDLKASDDKTKMLTELDGSLATNPTIWKLKNQCLDPVVHPSKSLAIYVGNSVVGQWGPWSLKDGIGGSEEAVIRLSRQLKGLGWDVTVFGTPLERDGDYDGIHWRNYWEYQSKDRYNALVVWRSPEFFDSTHNARKVYLWMHDVDDPAEFTTDRLNNLDKVMLLSQYHRDLFPNIPEDKVMYSANGIDPEEFEIDVERQPHKCVYTSSHVRGLERLYDIWPQVLQEVPDATLDVFYGWHSYDKITGDNPERKAWKEMMVNKAESLQGVTDHGKVGQDRIVQEMSSSSFWVYPTNFDEIFCITSIKAHAAGAIPIISDRAALKETAKYGVIEDFDSDWDNGGKERYTQILIKCLKESDQWDKVRNQNKDWAVNNWSWAKVAKDWADDIES